MAIEKSKSGALIITGEHIQWASCAAAFSLAKLDLKNGIKMNLTRAAWAKLAAVCGVDVPRGKRQKQLIYDAVKHNFPVMAGE